jgi:hypothetical protein
MSTDYTAMDTVRRDTIRRLWPKLPVALAVLARCATAPCDDREFRDAREVVLRWLQFSKACESQAIATRAQMRRKP